MIGRVVPWIQSNSSDERIGIKRRKISHNKISISLLPKDAAEHVIDATVQVCIDSYLADRFFTTCLLGGFDGNNKQPSLLQSLCRAIVKAGMTGGRVYVARFFDGPTEAGSDSDSTLNGDHNGLVVGVAIWFPPGTYFLDSAEQKDAGWNKFWGDLGSLNPKARDWWNYFILQVPFSTFTLAPWWLQCLCVRKEYKRHGVGLGLLSQAQKDARIFPLAKEANLQLCVSSFGYDLPLYKSFGFIVETLYPFNGPPEFGGEPFALYGCRKKVQPLWEAHAEEAIGNIIEFTAV